MVASGWVKKPRHYSPRQQPPAPPKGSQGVPKPAEICNPSSVFWVCPSVSFRHLEHLGQASSYQASPNPTLNPDPHSSLSTCEPAVDCVELQFNISIMVVFVCSFYLAVRREANSHLVDGTGHRPHYSLRTLCRALKYVASNPCSSVQRSLYEVGNYTDIIH